MILDTEPLLIAYCNYFRFQYSALYCELQLYVVSVADYHMLSTAVLIAYYFSSIGIFHYWHFPVPAFSSIGDFQYRYCPVPAFAVLAFSYNPFGSSTISLLYLMSFRYCSNSIGLPVILWQSLLTICSRDGNSAAYEAARCCWCTAPRSVATKICITSHCQRSVPTKICIMSHRQRSVATKICMTSHRQRSVAAKICITSHRQRSVATKICRGRSGDLDTEVVNCTLLENACRYKNRFGMK